MLEAVEYKFYVGSDVRSAEYACSFEQGENFVTERLTQSLAPVESFERIKPVCEGGAFSIGREAVPVSEVDESARRLEKLPKEIAYTGDKGIKLWDVKHGWYGFGVRGSVRKSQWLWHTCGLLFGRSVGYEA